MLTFLHRMSLAGLMISNPVELFDRIGRDPFYRRDMIGWVDGLALTPGAKVLELGCGTGSISLELAKRGHDVCALDRSPRMIARLRRSAERLGLGVASRVADACDTGLATGAYEAVIGASLLNIVKSPDALVDEALRLLVPGGKASFYFPLPAFNHDNVTRYIRDKSLPAASAAIFLTWSGGARKLDAGSAEKLFRAAGAQHVQFDAYLDGMIGSVTGHAVA